MLMQFYVVIFLSCFCKLNKNGRVRPSPLTLIDGSEQIFAALGNSLLLFFFRADTKLSWLTSVIYHVLSMR